ncbi:aspartate kinase [bacterium]|nr:aspartate kinase [bacterium]MBU1782806.1 aspartate kinase [bacterium]
MEILVQKYGGTSVGSIERIKKVAERVIEAKNEGNNVVVIVSAMSGETDKLIGMAKEITKDPNYRELDMLISTGEQISGALLAIALNAKGYEAISLTASQVKLYTDISHTKAKITKIVPERLLKELERGKIVIVAGFQGITEESEITTLGRGGSDTTAVAIAVSLGARICEIYTDVDGVYMADPRIVVEAKKLERISYEEMLELASSGAKVLQSRSVEFAKKYGVIIHVRSSFDKSKGTLIMEGGKKMEEILVSGVTYDKNQVKITIFEILDQPGIAAKVFSKLAEKNINVDMIIQSAGKDMKNNISFTVTREDLNLTIETMKEITKEVKAQGFEYDDQVAKVSLVGIGMRSHSGIASSMFQALALEGINIEMISTSEIKVSCVIKESQTEKAVKAIYKAFNLA